MCLMGKMNLKRRLIVLYDRGFMDNMAYMHPEAIKRLVAETGYEMDRMRDDRYDLVIHMMTAARGAEQFYTLANNQARTEGLEEARKVDEAIQHIWNGHPNHK